TSTGLQVKVEVMKRIYERGIKATENFLMGNFIRPDDEIPPVQLQNNPLPVNREVVFEPSLTRLFLQDAT
ncbi:hypothetical protein, partial [Rhodopirellula bahusiensis]